MYMNSLSFYFIILIINDTIQIILGPMRRLLLAIDKKLDPLIHSSAICKIWIFLIYFLNGFSAWILSVASVSRIKFILYSVKFEFTKRRLFQIITIKFVAICLIIVNFPLILNMKLIKKEDNQTVTVNSTISHINVIHIICNNDETQFKVKTAFIDLLVSSIIPFVIMITTSITSLVILWRVKNRNRFKLIATNNLVNGSRKFARTNNYQFAVTLIIVNALFLCLNLPICIFLVIANLDLIQPTPSNIYIMYLFNLKSIVNSFKQWVAISLVFFI